jgi:hypothetical protein
MWSMMTKEKRRLHSKRWNVGHEVFDGLKFSG